MELNKLADGAFLEKVNTALKEVLDNIKDPNTEWKVKRKLIIDMTFETGEDRELADLSITAKTKLAPTKDLKTKLVIDVNSEGEAIASEFKKQVPGQSYMKIDEETGEITTGEVNLDGIKLVK